MPRLIRSDPALEPDRLDFTDDVFGVVLFGRPVRLCPCGRYGLMVDAHCIHVGRVRWTAVGTFEFDPTADQPDACKGEG